MDFIEKLLASFAIGSKEGAVVSVIIRANAVAYSNDLICLDDHVAYVRSVNIKPKVWTIHKTGSEWAQCDYPITNQSMICKHSTRVYEIRHLGIDDGVIICEASTITWRWPKNCQCLNVCLKARKWEASF